MSTHHETIIGGARWMLTLHDDGRYEVARKGGAGRIWDDVLAGTGGLDGVRDAARALGLVEGMSTARMDVLRALAEVAEEMP